ncbi:putative glycosyl transferase, family 2 [Gordonia polyisoprenivorans VH2]|uniref:Putative glycosyl transferase, family 2 n=1 Tax=Gordonia polyisoprenivorans (strain DSM 44266 / VH2) TaxID=1112204 RepID=H6N1G7_GORPV|nr:putative glycosyl transferase, family 2 [Gordonia polyisoprenivorans VH2]
MSLLIVTPIHNEAENIGVLAQQVALSTHKPDLWVIVDDGSDDGCGSMVDVATMPCRTTVVRRDNDGGLIAGSAFRAWQYGIDYAVNSGDSFTHVMKLDADVDLPSDYLENTLREFSENTAAGVVGGVLVGLRDREQTVQVPGPVKMYSWEAYQCLESVPRAVGFDVLDEVAVKRSGFTVRVNRGDHVALRRAIGASQGKVHGRRRNGRVCRWTGYWFPYFLLHAIRYAFRPPRLVGSIAMILGYVSAGSGPYDSSLRKAHSQEQREKIVAALRNPKRWLRDTYSIKS